MRTYRSRNIEQARQKQRESSRRNADRRRAYSLKAGYGISVAYFDFLLRRQGGGCAICGAKRGAAGRYLSVDHDHKTGEVRGLLCDSCNHLLGQAEDDTERLARAVAYLHAPRPPKPAEAFGTDQGELDLSS